MKQHKIAINTTATEGKVNSAQRERERERERERVNTKRKRGRDNKYREKEREGGINTERELKTSTLRPSSPRHLNPQNLIVSKINTEKNAKRYRQRGREKDCVCFKCVCV